MPTREERDITDAVILREELDMLTLFARLAAFAIEEARRYGGSDIDGGAIQDEMVRLGILHTVTVNEPCGDNCCCAEYADFPQECLRLTPAAHEFAERMKGK